MEGPQLLAVSGVVAVVVVAAGLVEECMVCLGQQHSENKAIVVVEAGSRRVEGIISIGDVFRLLLS